jgi:2-amino-1-hydroxyethylphosphonate dioxygenase (glycine-forming)
MNSNSTLAPEVQEIFSLYEMHGNDIYGKDVTQLEHAVQSAQLAKNEGFEDEVILAALFHDIGHICTYQQGEVAQQMGEYGTMSHDKIGGAYLRNKGFPERLASLVENHVKAKRYLTFKDPVYYDKLSEASKQTLKYQGGPMTAAEAQNFEQDELFHVKLRMRHWDEEAKETDMPTPDLGRYQQMCQQYWEIRNP